ncbi:Gfo/Idh/MocA family oxidoreductase [Phycisphaerales bacterium AB-hyl4]|uniref:Gfo/Idh/MocA family oxidoreductase n=1 Tax=Natronomicrosphaera hydrolytica TaxID=3242702 RepID=A0ABV4U714_9BACT
MTSDTATQQVAVVGVGRMGRHHARIYRQNLPQANLVAVVDPDTERAATIADEHGCAALASVDELLAKFPNVSAVSVAVPTKYHMAAARPLLERRIACLIEKPLAPSVEEAKQIAALAAEHGTALQVGHTERFNPAVQAVAKMGITPRFIEIDRVSPMTFRSLDVSVVMDMMIHDLDIVLMLVGSPIRKVDAAGVAVLGQHEDVASARIVFETGCLANITASRLALKTERKMRLFSEDAYVSLDYQQRSGVVLRTSRNRDALAKVREQLVAGMDLTDMDYSDIVQVDELRMDVDENEYDPLTSELASFLDAARTGKAPSVDARAGYEAVDAAERVAAAMREHKWEGLEGMSLRIDEHR